MTDVFARRGKGEGFIILSIRNNGTSLGVQQIGDLPL